MAYGTNCWSWLPASSEAMAANLRAFAAVVRSGHSDVVVVVISPVMRPKAEASPNILDATLADLRRAIEAVATQEPGVRLASGLEALADATRLPNGIHPDDLKNDSMARVVSAALAAGAAR